MDGITRLDFWLVALGSLTLQLASVIVLVMILRRMFLLAPDAPGTDRTLLAGVDPAAVDEFVRSLTPADFARADELRREFLSKQNASDS